MVDHRLDADEMARIPPFQDRVVRAGLGHANFGQQRAAVLENLSADFARTARAKGLAENAVLFRHVLSNSMLPLITMAAAILPTMLGGSLIVERIFSIPGMGQLTIDSIFLKDQEVVLSLTLVIALVSVISLLIADICYALADPRITYD